MRVLSAASLRAMIVCGLLLLTAFPALAFDEDHHEVINGAMLHFRVRGANKANPYLVILHGGPGFSAHMFYPWGPSLEKSLNVVYLDQRGCGESARLSVADPENPKPSEIQGYTFRTLDADIEGVRQFLKVSKWYVLGHSYGGMLGVEYVAAHPEHVLGYIHMDGLVSVPQVQTAILDNAANKFAAAKDDGDLAAVAKLRALPPDNPARLIGAFGLALGPADLYFAGNQPAAFTAFYGQIGAAIKPYSVPPAALMPADEPGTALIVNDHYLTRDDTPLLAKIIVPVLIINGKQDGVITPQSAEAVHAAIKGSQLILLDACGHFPFFEQPQKTTQAILDFTNAQKPRLRNQEAGPVGRYAAPEVPNGLDVTSLSSSQVVIGFVVNEAGSVEQLHVIQSCGIEPLDRACANAVRKTQFQPAMTKGVLMPARVEHTFSFAQQ